MEVADRLADRLGTHPVIDGARVEQWRFSLAARRSVGAGLKNNRLGGPYDAPSGSIDLTGGVYLVWSDGRISLGDLDAWSLDEFDERLAEWRAAAYEDPWRPEVLGARPLPEVELYDPTVARQIESDPGPLFHMLERAQATCHDLGAHLVDAGVGAAVADVVLRSSQGLDVSFSETNFDYSASVDDAYSRAWRKRRAIREDEIVELLDEVGRTGRALQQPASLEGGELPVLLTTHTAGAFLARFLATNLEGARVVNNQSAFTLADFQQQRAVARPDFGLVLDTTLPFEAGSSVCSDEGVPGGQAALLERGCLRSPLLDLRHARRAELPPSPLPRRGSALQVRADTPASWGDTISSLTRGLVVYELLGMHTQDSLSGEFSVVASQALAVHDGTPIGRVKATLAGNFFDVMRDADTRFIPWAAERNPGMLLRCLVRVDPAA